MNVSATTVQDPNTNRILVNDLLTKAACLLFINGHSSEGTSFSVHRLGQALGVKVDLLLRWDEVILFVEEHPALIIHPAQPIGVDMRRVTAVLDIIDAVEARRMNAGQAAQALEGVSRMPPVPLPRFALAAGAGAAALAVIFGANDTATLAVVAFSACCGAILRRAVSRLSSNPLLQPFAAALFAGLAGTLAIAAGLRVDPRLVLVCPCMVLVPGPHVLNGTIDLSRARVTIGTARLAYAGLVVLMICSGLLLGLTAGDIDLPITSSPVAVPWLHDAIAAGIAVAAFGTFFNMTWRMLPVPIIVGVTAHSAHWLLLDMGVSMTAARLAACFIVGVCVTPLADRLHHPFAAYAFSAVVSMIPGVFLFDAAAALVKLTILGDDAPPALLVNSAVSSIGALLIILAMTAGLIVPRMIYVGYMERRMLRAKRRAG